MRYASRFLIWLIPWAAVSSGCGIDDFPSAVDPTLEEINRIRDDSDLTVAQRRNELAELGLSPELINALLRDRRTGNQFGGDLRSAYEKVAGGRLDELTPDEVQIYGDAASDEDDELDVSFSDAQAQDLVNLFRDNGIETQSAIGAFLDESANAALIPESVEADDIRAVFVDFDSSLLLDQLP